MSVIMCMGKGHQLREVEHLLEKSPLGTPLQALVTSLKCGHVGLKNFLSLLMTLAQGVGDDIITCSRGVDECQQLQLYKDCDHQILAAGTLLKESSLDSLSQVKVISLLQNHVPFKSLLKTSYEWDYSHQI